MFSGVGGNAGGQEGRRAHAVRPYGPRLRTSDCPSGPVRTRADPGVPPLGCRYLYAGVPWKKPLEGEEANRNDDGAAAPYLGAGGAVFGLTGYSVGGAGRMGDALCGRRLQGGRYEAGGLRSERYEEVTLRGEHYE